MMAFQLECQLPTIRLVRGINPKQLAHAYFPGKEYEFLVSNRVEIMNNCLNADRKILVVA